jgi:acetyl/propionyl-CoA carboxylase alpha subunit
MTKVAVTIDKPIRYQEAGTVEFLLASRTEASVYHFLMMNRTPRS